MLWLGEFEAILFHSYPPLIVFTMPFSGQNLVIALYLIQGLVAGHPLPGSSQCVDDDVLLSFQQGDTSLLCENVLIANETTVTQQEVISAPDCCAGV